MSSLNPRASKSRPNDPDKDEPIWMGLLFVLTLFLASLPVLMALKSLPAGWTFVGATYNIDDFCNYLAWMRWIADGHFFQRNLFTTDPQLGQDFNLLFVLMGNAARITGASLLTVWHLVRVGGGLLLLIVLACFYRHCLPGPRNRHARMAALGFACLSAGFGWARWPLWADTNKASGLPPDVWQPEGFTFLSLTCSALFVVSTLLILAALFLLLKSEQTGRVRYAVGAGLCAAVLGNIHSYDILHIAAAWGLFLVVWTVRQHGRGVASSWGRGVLALALALPTAIHKFWIFRHDPVFYKRAEVPTVSPAFGYYILGYGLVFLLAAVGVWLAARGRASEAGPSFADERAKWFVACWAVAGLAVIYLGTPHHPVAFQRKMLMGEHLPLCLLAGYAAAWLLRSWKPQARIAALNALVLLTFPTNALFLVRDIGHLSANKSETTLRPYLSPTEADVYSWMRANTPPDAAVAANPLLCTPLPGLTGRAVWAGHWGETPQFAEKVKQFNAFADASTPDEARRQFLTDTRAQYLLYPRDVSAWHTVDKQGRGHDFADFARQTPPELTPVYANKDYVIFQIHL